jgi:toxin FitB
VSFLLDTNVVSEARRRDGSPRVKAWVAARAPEELHVSVLLVGEIRGGIERLRRRDPAQAEVYEAWLQGLQRDYAERVIPITSEIAEEWGRLNSPHPIPTVDGLMAATARVRGMTVVTRNTADIARTGVLVLNPWEEAD